MKLIIIGGHTASGKTELGMEIATMLGTEIISADSMLVYRHMDIGTAKPAPEDMARVKHHMIDIIEPWELFTLSEYYNKATLHIADMELKKKVPLIVGGTGFYINAVINGMYQSPASSPEVRMRLEQRISSGEDLGVLHEELRSVDPKSAERIHRNDKYRIMRALEVYHSTGKTMSYFREQHNISPDAASNTGKILFLVLKTEKEELKKRVEARTKKMIGTGLIEEVKGLLALGCTEKTKSMKSIGYKQIVMHLKSELSLEDAQKSIIEETLGLAKRQNTWFKGRKNTRFYSMLSKSEIINDIRTFMGL